jgi:hypothetical protein
MWLMGFEDKGTCDTTGDVWCQIYNLKNQKNIILSILAYL